MSLCMAYRPQEVWNPPNHERPTAVGFLLKHAALGVHLANFDLAIDSKLIADECGHPAALQAASVFQDDMGYVVRRSDSKLLGDRKS